ncbi:MAG: sensor histidine kinase [Chloroflexi bacterium]|nr:sensor histidine kinase [Chloroflexota bacterium]
MQEAQLRALKAQINPHFLFNSLTLLGYTALEEGAARTEEIAYNLSDLLRYSLRNMSTQVELGVELEMIEQYLAIQKISFGDRLQSQVLLDAEMAHIEVPCMILQPLVENAVIHGAEPLTRPVMITVRATRQLDYLILEVADDGVGMPEAIVRNIENGRFEGEGASLGLQNVFQRLVNEYGDSVEIGVKSAPDQGTLIHLAISLTADNGRIIRPSAQQTLPKASGIGNQISFDHAQLPLKTPPTLAYKHGILGKIDVSPISPPLRPQ